MKQAPVQTDMVAMDESCGCSRKPTLLSLKVAHDVTSLKRASN